MTYNDGVELLKPLKEVIGAGGKPRSALLGLGFRV